MGPVQRALKRLRMGVKQPAQAAAAWAWTLPLDRRPRTIADLDFLEPRSIVASRTDRIGDLLCASPLLWALHRRWPNARLVVIAGPKNRGVLPGLPYVEPGPVFRRDPASWTEVAWWLARRSFDLCVSLRAESMAGAYIAAWSRAPVRMVTHATKASRAFNLFLGPDEWHQTTRYCHAAALLGVPCEEVRPVFSVPEEAERRAAESFPELLPRGGEPLVGLQIPHRGSERHAVRAWPVESVIALARGLVADGCRVVLCGAGSERVEAEYVRACVAEAIVVPVVPLIVFAAIQRRFDLFISGFTGTLHLADAVGIPAVAYGLEEQVGGWGLVGPRHRSIAAASLADIQVQTLLDAARSALSEARR